MSKYGVISGPNAGKYGPEITPFFDIFHAASCFEFSFINVNKKNPKYPLHLLNCKVK